MLKAPYLEDKKVKKGEETTLILQKKNDGYSLK